MPLYSHKCENCGHTEDFFRPMSRSHEDPPCPACGYAFMGRDVVAEHGSPRHAECEEQYSDAAGVHPSQIAECKAKFPHHEFAPDGRMIFRGQRHKERCLKDLGFVEYDKRDLKTQ